MGVKRTKPTVEALLEGAKNGAPIPIYEPRYYLCFTLTQCLALADGVVTPEVQSMAGMVDRPSQVPGQLPYGVVFVPGEPL